MSNQLTSNIDDVSLWLDGILDSIDFQMPGKDKSLGLDLAGIQAERIVDRSVPDAEGPEGDVWLANERKYAAWKLRKYGADQPGILTGQMLSIASMLGDVRLTANQVQIVYGTNTKPRQARTRIAGRFAKEKKEITDREKARHFHDSGRVFMGFGAGDEEALVDAFAEMVGAFLGI